MKTALAALIFSCALILLPASYVQASAPASPPSGGGNTVGSPPAITPSGSTSGAAHHPGPCHDDVQKFCGNVQKGGGRVLACLKEHEGQLSPRCEAGMKRHASGQQAAPAQGSAGSTGSTPPAK